MKNKVLRISLKVIVCVIIVLFIQAQALCLTQVYKWSMYTTLSEKDVLVSEKLTYRFTKPKLEDIVIFIVNPEDGFKGTRTGILVTDYYNKIMNKEPIERYIKRVIGVEGDTIDLKNGKVFINGKELDETYIVGETYPSNQIAYPYTVPEGQVFVLGDNRENSLDSRHFGAIDLEQVESKVICRIWPYKSITASFN